MFWFAAVEILWIGIGYTESLMLLRSARGVTIIISGWRVASNIAKLPALLSRKE